jgi:5'(3')-deoxyribonucleotidase
MEQGRKMENNKKVLYVDMDNVIVDFETGIERVPKFVMEAHVASAGLDDNGEPKDLDDIPGIFSLMEPMKDAVESILDLARVFDLYLLSSSPWNNPSAWSDKIRWVHLHFGNSKQNPIYKRLILSHHKNLNDGHFLVDDRLKNGAELFGQKAGSEHIHFGQGEHKDWKQVHPYLMDRA